jgi:hypothetical protein
LHLQRLSRSSTSRSFLLVLATDPLDARRS